MTDPTLQTNNPYCEIAAGWCFTHGSYHFAPANVDPDREVVYQAEKVLRIAQLDPEQMRALGVRLAQYRRNRMRAEAEYYREVARRRDDAGRVA
jgi:hypothetical protein